MDSTSKPMTNPALRHRAAVAAGVLVVVGLCLSGCGVVKAAEKAEHTVKGNKDTIDNFTNTIKSSSGTTFEATYVTTGASPATIVYAVEPPQGLAFEDTPSGASSPNVDIIVNSSGEYSCYPIISGLALGAVVPAARDGRCESPEPDLRLLHAVALDQLPEGFLARRRAWPGTR